MRIGLVCDNRAWADDSEPFQAVAAGLRRLGHAVEVVGKAAWPLWGTLPEAVFLWNGVHGLWGDCRRRLAEAGVPVLVMERGFFDRFNHTQIDPGGFNHTASWARAVRGPAPAGGLARFVSAWRAAPSPFRRRSGYALLLLQVPADAQLRDAEIHHSGPFVQAVEAAAPLELELRVRAHPLSRWHCGHLGRARMIEGSLADALAGAAFCVTVNSNSGNEALAMGCPVLCLGPALYAQAGVARQASLADLERAVAEMCEGWRPADAAVRNYLAHLACRQWSRDELAAGWPLRSCLDRCGPARALTGGKARSEDPSAAS